jgi:hypothetical protein
MESTIGLSYNPLLAFLQALFLALHKMRQQCHHIYLLPHLWVHQLKNQ